MIGDDLSGGTMAELRGVNGSAEHEVASRGWVSGIFGPGGSFSGKAVASAGSEAGELLKAAKSGGFRISEQGAKPLLDALTKMRERLFDLRDRVRILDQEPKLGSHEYGRTVAAHDRKTGSGGPGSAQVMLQQFDEVLRQSIEALQRASGQYQDAEGNAARPFGVADPSA
jgi:hypothetical protein